MTIVENGDHKSAPCILREMTFIPWVMWSGLKLIIPLDIFRLGNEVFK